MTLSLLPPWEFLAHKLCSQERGLQKSCVLGILLPLSWLRLCPVHQKEVGVVGSCVLKVTPSQILIQDHWVLPNTAAFLRFQILLGSPPHIHTPGKEEQQAVFSF
jgi:hypothetical protein